MPGNPSPKPTGSKASSSSSTQSSSSAAKGGSGTKPKVSQKTITNKKTPAEFLKKENDLELQQSKSKSSGGKKSKAPAKGHPKGSLKSTTALAVAAA